MQTSPASQRPSRSLRLPERDSREWNNSNNKARASSSSLEKSPADCPPVTKSAIDDRRWSLFCFIIMTCVFHDFFELFFLDHMPVAFLGGCLDLGFSFARKVTEQFTHDGRLSSPRSRAKQHRRDNHSTRTGEEEATQAR